jgi:DNA polymerase-3 subunit delta
MTAKRAAPAPPLAEIEQRIEQGWSPGLTVLTGDDAFSLDRAQQALLSRLGGDDDSDFGRTMFGDEKVDVSTVVGAARSVGMFSTRRVVFVSEVGALQGDPDALAEYAGSPPPSSYLIVRAPSLDRRRKLHQTLARAGILLTFETGDMVQARRQIAQMSKERGLSIDNPSAGMLAELTGGDLYRASNELEKIRAWLGERDGRVTQETIRDVAAGGGLMSGWEVADAVMRRDRAAGLAAVRRLTAAGDEAIRIVGGLAWRARVLLKAKAMAEAGRRPDEILKRTRAFYFKQALLDGIRRYTLQELLAFPAALLRADRTLKSRSIDSSAVLEDLVDRLTGAAGSVKGYRR